MGHNNIINLPSMYVVTTNSRVKPRSLASQFIVAFTVVVEYAPNRAQGQGSYKLIGLNDRYSFFRSDRYTKGGVPARLCQARGSGFRSDESEHLLVAVFVDES